MELEVNLEGRWSWVHSFLCSESEILGKLNGVSNLSYIFIVYTQ